jgi:hypothetical protein
MMLEGKSYLVSRSLLSSCETETQWAYLAHDVLGGERPTPEDVEVKDLDEADGDDKRSKPTSPCISVLLLYIVLSTSFFCFANKKNLVLQFTMNLMV